jgi:hypothetical protein
MNFGFQFCSCAFVLYGANYNFLRRSVSMSAHFFICVHYRHLMPFAVKSKFPGELNKWWPTS